MKLNLNKLRNIHGQISRLSALLFDLVEAVTNANGKATLYLTVIHEFMHHLLFFYLSGVHFVFD